MFEKVLNTPLLPSDFKPWQVSNFTLFFESLSFNAVTFFSHVSVRTNSIIYKLKTDIPWKQNRGQNGIALPTLSTNGYLCNIDKKYDISFFLKL